MIKLTAEIDGSFSSITVDSKDSEFELPEAMADFAKLVFENFRTKGRGYNDRWAPEGASVNGTE